MTFFEELQKENRELRGKFILEKKSRSREELIKELIKRRESEKKIKEVERRLYQGFIDLAVIVGNCFLDDCKTFNMTGVTSHSSFCKLPSLYLSSEYKVNRRFIDCVRKFYKIPSFLGIDTSTSSLEFIYIHNSDTTIDDLFIDILRKYIHAKGFPKDKIEIGRRVHRRKKGYADYSFEVSSVRFYISVSW